MRYVILPQALRIAMPPTVGFLVQLVKSTALASIVGFNELIKAGQIVTNATFQPARGVRAGGADLFLHVLSAHLLRADARAQAQPIPLTQDTPMTARSNPLPLDANAPMVEMRNVSKWYGKFQALKNVSLTVRKGERMVICGPSGSGKSTAIRCINWLEHHQEGQILIEGVELTPGFKNIDLIRREVGMVFQQFNLFPHLTVLQNLTLAPRQVRRHRPRRKRRRPRCAT